MMLFFLLAFVLWLRLRYIAAHTEPADYTPNEVFVLVFFVLFLQH